MGERLKEAILARTGSYEILNHFLRPYHNFGNLKQGQHISNPFILPRRQRTPSFNIYRLRGRQQWRYKDFATADEGDAFDLVMQLYGCGFRAALDLINREMGLGLEKASKNYSSTLPLNPRGELPAYAAEEIQNKSFSLVWRSMEIREAAWWMRFGISNQILETYHVRAVESFTTQNRQGKSYQVKSTPPFPIFAYQLGEQAYKIYKPMARQFRFLYLGEMPHPYRFGWEQLPPEGRCVFLTGGEKDVMSLRALGIPAICFNSETSMPDQATLEALKQRFDQVVILYDADNTGITRSRYLAREFDLQRAELPPMDLELGHKDISDYVYFHYPLTPLEALFKSFQLPKSRSSAA